MGIPYIRVHFINDQCSIVGADILNIGDYSARSPLSFVGGRVGFVTYVSTYEFFRWCLVPHGISRSGPIRVEPSRCIKHYVNSIAK